MINKKLVFGQCVGTLTHKHTVNTLSQPQAGTCGRLSVLFLTAWGTFYYRLSLPRGFLLLTNYAENKNKTKRKKKGSSFHTGMILPVVVAVALILQDAQVHLTPYFCAPMSHVLSAFKVAWTCMKLAPYDPCFGHAMVEMLQQIQCNRSITDHLRKLSCIYKERKKRNSMHLAHGSWTALMLFIPCIQLSFCLIFLICDLLCNTLHFFLWKINKNVVV